jgi:hypothetical protein
MPALFQKQTCCQISLTLSMQGILTQTQKSNRASSQKILFSKVLCQVLFEKSFLFFSFAQRLETRLSFAKQDYLVLAKPPGVRFFKEDSLKSPNKSR